MLSQKKKVVVVMPAYNASETLVKTVEDIPRDCVDDIILVDDASSDNTFELAKEIGLRAVKHDVNSGYGANQKTCYSSALEFDADIIIMIHPDYQYDPTLIPYFVNMINEGRYSVVLGSRIRTREEVLAGGMPLYKYVANRALSTIENIITGHNLTDWHTGMRAYDASVLKKVDYDNYSDDFVFDSQMLFGIIEEGFKMGEFPVPVRYFDEASSINFKRSLTYGLQTVGVALGFSARKIKKAIKTQVSSKQKNQS